MMVQRLLKRIYPNPTLGSVTLSTLTMNSYSVGTWTTPAFNAGDYTASGSMTWTVAEADVQTLAYTILGKVMTVSFSVNSTTVGGTPNTALRIKIPASKTPAKDMYTALGILSDNGTLTTGNARVNTSTDYIAIFRTDAANFTASTDNTSVRGQITFEIN